MSTQHTPGPWFCSNVFTDDQPFLGIWFKGDVADADFNPICTIAPSDQITPIQWANARLISAAPEMLSMLQEIVNLHEAAAQSYLRTVQTLDSDSDYEHHYPYPAWYQAARALIYKASINT